MQDVLPMDRLNAGYRTTLVVPSICPRVFITVSRQTSNPHIDGCLAAMNPVSSSATLIFHDEQYSTLLDCKKDTQCTLPHKGEQARHSEREGSPGEVCPDVACQHCSQDLTEGVLHLALAHRRYMLQRVSLSQKVS